MAWHLVLIGAGVAVAASLFRRLGRRINKVSIVNEGGLDRGGAKGQG